MFAKYNNTFLKNGGAIQRIYICDSLADSVNEKWFLRNVIEQIKLGAEVKIIEVTNEEIKSCEDYGIYDHQTEEEQKYLLLIANSPGSQEQYRPTLISPIPKKYQLQFDDWWDKYPEPLRLIAAQDSKSFEISRGEPHKINDLFENRVILRNMIRLDTGDKLIEDGNGFVRKYEKKYAQIVDKYIRANFDFNHLIYIGDTYKNDGGFLRNLQLINHSYLVSGFICEPSLNISNLWFNSIYYSNKWTDILSFLQNIYDKLSERTLAIFDIDQTLWAAKGQNDGPIHLARINAIRELINNYIPTDGAYRNHIHELIPNVYSHIKGIEYNKITFDNEDYKAILTVCIALSIYGCGFSDRDNPFSQINYNPQNISWDIQQILTPYIKKRGIEAFVLNALGEVFTEGAEIFARDRGIDIVKLRNEIREVHINIRAQVPAPYTAFRKCELKETIKLAKNHDCKKITNCLTINMTTWNVAQFFAERGMTLIGLSDRPDEATYDLTSNLSLLNTAMPQYGYSIIDNIKGLIDKK